MHAGPSAPAARSPGHWLTRSWNVPYNFNNGDLTICKDVLYNYLEANVKVPWADLKYMFCDIFYGGHIGDDLDRRLMRSFMDSLMSDALFEDGKYFAPDFPAPPPMGYDGYKQFIAESLPEESPKIFGLHPNAEITFLTQQSVDLFSMLMQLQPRSAGSSNAGEMTREERCKQQLEDILDALPEGFNMMEITDRVEERTPYVSVCLQECECMNNLLICIRTSLKDLGLGLKGDLTISEAMETLMNSMYMDRVPDLWASKAYPSMKALGPWLRDLDQRCRQLQDWSSDLGLPRSVWLPGLFNPQSFLRAVLQTTARANMWPLDKMALLTEITKKEVSDITAPPREGAYIHGLFMDGARWDKKAGCIKDAILKDLYPEIPPIFLKAVPSEKAETKDVYDCPVYKTKKRGSLTYVWNFQLKTREPPSTWILAGVCLLMASDV